MNDAGALILLALLSLTLSFFFSGMEAGVLALNRLRIRQQMRAGHPAARRLFNYLERAEDFLWTILVGNALANFIVVSLVYLLFHEWLGAYPLGLLLALVVMLFLLYALGDLLPKMLFRQAPTRLCLAMARPFGAVHFALAPLVVLVDWVARGSLRVTGGQRFTGSLFGNREELRTLMQESAQSLSTEERTMVNRVLDLQTLTVGALTVPLDRVVTVSATTPIAEVFALCQQTGHTRVPVRELADRGRILGFVNLKATLFLTRPDEPKTARDFLESALYLDEAMRLEAALQRLRDTGQRLAIVLDRDRREIGILTLEDILRFIFGEVSL